MFFPFAAIIGLMLIWFGKLREAKGAVRSGILLLLFAVWDYYMFSWRSPTGDMAIRADAVLLLPLSLVVIISGVKSLFQLPSGDQEK